MVLKTNEGRRTCACACTRDLARFERKPELPYYGVVDFIAEFWNTVSNGPMIWIGLLRSHWLWTFAAAMGPAAFNTRHLWTSAELEAVATMQTVQILYGLLAVAGVCSAFHHAVRMRHSIIVDWIPIALSMLVTMHGVVATGTLALSAVSGLGWVLLGLALLCLVSDHVWTCLPVPIGHCTWHVLAAVALDRVYADFVVGSCALLESTM